MHLQFSRRVLGTCAQRLAHSDRLFTKQFGECSCLLKCTSQRNSTVTLTKTRKEKAMMYEDFVLIPQFSFEV